MIRVGSMWSFTDGGGAPPAAVGGEWIVMMRHRGIRVWPWFAAWWGWGRA